QDAFSRVWMPQFGRVIESVASKTTLARLRRCKQPLRSPTRYQDQVAFEPKEACGVDLKTPADKSSGGAVQIRLRHQIEVGLFCEETITQRLINNPIDPGRQPMQQGELRVKLDWKPSIGGRKKNAATGNPQTLDDHANLVFRRSDMLERGRGMNQVERPCRKREMKVHWRKRTAHQDRASVETKRRRCRRQ